MPLLLSELRRMIRKPMGVEEDELSNEECDLYLNRSFWEVMDKFPFREKEKVGTFETNPGQRIYTLPILFEYLNSLSVRKDDCKGEGCHKQLKQITHETYEDIYCEGIDNWDMPRKYVRQSCTITLWPTPDKQYKLTIKRNIVLADLEEEVNPTPVLPQVWHEIIGYGGLWRAYIDFDDFNRANAAKAHQVSLINTLQPTESKEEHANTQYASLQVPGREY